MSVSINGTNGLTFNDGSTQTTSPFTGGFGFRNRIINGDMRIDQRNAGASVTPNLLSYPVDRTFGFGSVTGKFSCQQNSGSVTPPAGFINYIGAVSLSAYSVGSGEQYIFGQVIEGLNVADLGWGTASASTVTLSFWVRSSLTGTFGGALQNDGFNRSYPFSYTISAANTWEQKTITVAGDTSGTWLKTNGAGIRLAFSLGAGSTMSGTAGAWAGANYVSATGATSVVGTNGATFYITGVQLEKGSTATSFDYRPYGTELALCQRYYQLIGFGLSMPVTSGQTYGGVLYFNAMRSAPTYTFISPNSVGNFGTSPNFTDIWLNAAMRWTAVANGTGYGVCSYYASLSSEL
jgi:hypothetical protein